MFFMNQDQQHGTSNTSGNSGPCVPDRINACVMYHKKGSQIHTMHQKVREKQDIHMLGDGCNQERVVAKGDDY